MKKLIALLLTAVLCVSLCACGRDGDSYKPQSPATPAVSDPAPDQTIPTEADTTTAPATEPGIALSDDPADLTISVDGVVYQLPCDAKVFLDNAWLPESDWVLEDDFEIPGGESRGFDMYKTGENKEIGLRVYNPGKDARKFGDCIVYEIYNEIDTDVDFILSGKFELSKDLTAQDVFDVFGSDYEYNQFNGDWYEYTWPGKVHYTFTIKEDSLAYFSLELAKAVYEN